MSRDQALNQEDLGIPQPNGSIEHRATYSSLTIYEDYLAICEGNKKRSKAIILSLLEKCLNDLSEGEEYVTISYRQIEQSMYGLCGYNTIISSLAELEGEGLIERRTGSGSTPTYQYRLRIEVIQAKLDALPERNYVGKRRGYPKSYAYSSTVQYFQGKCAYCSEREATTIDHLIPLAKGGFTVQGNLVPSCHYCNCSKGDTDVLVWLQAQNIKPCEALEQMIRALYGNAVKVRGGEDQ